MKIPNNELNNARKLLAEFEKSEYQNIADFSHALNILEDLISEGNFSEKQIAQNLISSYAKKLFKDGYIALKNESGDQCSNVARALTEIEAFVECDRLKELQELRESLANKWRASRKKPSSPLEIILEIKEHMTLIGTPINVINNIFTNLTN